MDVNAHYVDEEFKLHSRTLTVRGLPDESHTALLIKNELESVLGEYHILWDEEFHVVTDGGSNMTGALGIESVCNREDCYCHLVATIIRRVLHKTHSVAKGTHYKYFEEVPEVFRLIDGCHSIAGYFNRTSLNKKLKHSLKQANDTRWGSLLAMLESVLNEFEDVVKIITEKGKTKLLSNINKDLLQRLVNLLKPFNEVTKILEVYSNPTLQNILFCREELISHLNDVSKDSETIKILKGHLLEELMAKWNIKTIHVAATLLHPFEKDTLEQKGVSEDKINEAKELILSFASRKRSSISNDQSMAQANSPSTSNEPKRIRLSSMFQKRHSTTEQPTKEEKIKREMSIYLATDVPEPPDNAENWDILSYWKENEHVFPYLSFAVRSILAIPANSAKTESDFSDCGNTKTAQRANLSPEHLCDLMILNNNNDLI